MVAVALKIKAHEWPIKSMAILADGPRILTGSADCTVKVRFLAFRSRHEIQLSSDYECTFCVTMIGTYHLGRFRNLPD